MKKRGEFLQRTSILMRGWLSALALTALVGCQQSNTVSPILLDSDYVNIIGGSEVTGADPLFKSVARVFYKYNGIWFPSCSAVILTEDIILTAGHCVSGITVSNLLVGFAAQPISIESQNNIKTRVDPSKKFQTTTVSKMAISSDFLNNVDFALLKINGTIPKNFRVAELLPAKYLSQDKTATIFEGKNMPLSILGYGEYVESSTQSSAILRKASIQGNFVGKKIIGDQTKGSGACRGDSGGPAFVFLNGAYYLVGITHGPYGSGVNDCHHQALWWNPSVTRDYLSQTISQLGGKPVKVENLKF